MRAPLQPIGMAERDGSAVDVDLLGRDAKLALGDHGHHGERLVDLEEVDLPDVQSIFSSSSRMAAMGAVVNHSGCWLQVAAPLMTAIGLSFAARQCSGEATRSAAAPSLMLEAFPAVIVPSGTNAGLRARSLASSNFAGPSSFVTRVVLPLDGYLDRARSRSRKRRRRSPAGRGCGFARRSRPARSG